MSETTSTFSDADLEALFASGHTAPATLVHPPAADTLGQRLETVTEILSRLGSLPAEASLISEVAAGTVRVTAIGDSLVTGRSSKCGLVCRAESGLSKRHFEVFRQEGEYFVRDLNSTNGTRANERPCPHGEVRHLLDGDVIVAGGSLFVFLAGMNGAAESQSIPGPAD